MESEFGVIDWLRRRAAAHGAVPLGIGDDCAAIRFGGAVEALVTTDMLMDGRHFRLGSASAAEVGRKALGVNLSDIAAMAGRPVAAFVAVALPKDEAGAIARGLWEGMRPLAERFEVALAGGDTNAWDGPLVVCVTVVGAATARGAVRRSGARPGDALLVTGPLGGSLLGRHLRPRPRVAEALAIHELVDIHAMIDISDGLAADLGHVLVESGGLGAVLDEGAVPVHEDAVAMARDDGRSPLEHALHDGEDFELLLAVAPGDADRLLAAPPAGCDALRRLGTVSDRPGLRLRSADGAEATIRPLGFDHLAC
ncbi:MAG TPA: thiamine-phosphate kinase [Isosphaeraceae bacterium]|jgi:thiamine-monophosphate kinase|nr:thiamine-phosphate kinase [Isosphaeraceae bacterium]